MGPRGVRRHVITMPARVGLAVKRRPVSSGAISTIFCGEWIPQVASWSGKWRTATSQKTSMWTWGPPPGW
eukprot:1652080-Prorocentrum_lima.AAC.1